MDTDTETMNVKKILLVEDDPQDVKLTLAGLAENNLANKVAVVRDGAEALDYLYCRGKFKTRPPGNPILVLLDNKMPKVSGLQVLKTIKIDENLKTIPVVVLTSSRETPDLIEFYKHGVNAYVVKPVDFADFMKAVKQLGIFWAAVNEPPPSAWLEAASTRDDEIIFPIKKEEKNGIPAPHPASGR
jgi:CheY-like chemotaxis protein